MLKVAIPDQGGHLGVKGCQAATLEFAGAVLLAELADRLGLPG